MNFRFTVNKNPLSIEFDSATIAEGLQVLLDNKNELGRVVTEFRGEAEDVESGETNNAGAAGAGEAGKTLATPKRRGRPPAAAPAPAPVPVVGAPAPVAPVAPAAPAAALDMRENANGIPMALARTEPAPAAPFAPPAPPPPPVAPAPAPVVRVSDKVIADLKKRREGAPDGGQSLADWLAGAGVVAKGATFDESMAVLQFIKDEQAAPLAQALGV